MITSCVTKLDVGMQVIYLNYKVLCRMHNVRLGVNVLNEVNCKRLLCTNIRKQLRSNKTNGNKFQSTEIKKKSKSTLYYLTATGVLAVGMSYAAVPLYRIFCQVRHAL